MVGRSKRRIFEIGASKAITLPKEWVDDIKDKEVHVIFDKVLLVFGEKQAAEGFVEKYIEKVTGVPIASE